MPVHVSVPGSGGVRRRKNLVVHRRDPKLLTPAHVRTYRGIPVTGPGETIIDIALSLTLDEFDATVSEADKLDHIDPVRLRALAVANPHRPGAGRVRRALDRHTFVLSDSALERLFVPLCVRAASVAQSPAATATRTASTSGSRNLVWSSRRTGSAITVRRHNRAATCDAIRITRRRGRSTSASVTGRSSMSLPGSSRY